MASRKNTRGDGADTAAEEELEALFAAPLEEFTQAKKEAAKRLRAAGQEDAADEVLALQKPNLPAWVVNQLARAYPDDMRALLESGERLKEAQQRALQGEGADALREGTRAQRGLVLVLSEDAGELLRRAGKAANPATLDQVQATLTAGANGTEEERALLEKGRLVRPLERVSFGGLVDVRAPAPPPKAKAPEDKRAKEAEREHQAAEKRAKEAERERKEAEKRAGAARKEADKRAAQQAERDRAAEQQRAAKEAERRAKEAEQERKEAEKRAKEAERERAAAAQRAAKEAERQRAEAQRREQMEARERAEALRAEVARGRKEAQRLVKSANAAEAEARRLETAARKAEEAATRARARADEAREKAATVREDARAAEARVAALAESA